MEPARLTVLLLPVALNGRGSQSGGRGPGCPPPAGHHGPASALHPRAASDELWGLPTGRTVVQALRAAEGIPVPSDLRGEGPGPTQEPVPSCKCGSSRVKRSGVLHDLAEPRGPAWRRGQVCIVSPSQTGPSPAGGPHTPDRAAGALIGCAAPLCDLVSCFPSLCLLPHSSPSVMGLCLALC